MCVCVCTESASNKRTENLNQKGRSLPTIETDFLLFALAYIFMFFSRIFLLLFRAHTSKKIHLIKKQQHTRNE